MPKKQTNSLNDSSLPSLLAQDWPPQQWLNLTSLVGVSGGADSVALLRGMHQLREGSPHQGKLMVAHVNHGTRAIDSDRDESWVSALAIQLGLPFFCQQLELSVDESHRGQGFEAQLREARHRCLRQIAEATGARYIALGHSQDDQVETILFRILRGTGIGGLAGIPRIRRLSDWITIVRPMLNISRATILDYLSSIKQDYLEDDSNTNQEFTRNRIRHQLLPQLRRDFNVNVDRGLLQLAGLAAEAQSIIDGDAEALIDKVVCFKTNGEVVIQTKRIQQCPDYLVRTLLALIWKKMNWPQQDMSYSKWAQLAELLASTTNGNARQRQSSLTLPGHIRAERFGQEVRFFEQARDDGES